MRERPIKGLPTAPLISALLLSVGIVLVLTVVFYRPVVIYQDSGEYMEMAKLISQQFSSDPLNIARLGVVTLRKIDLPFGKDMWKYAPGYPLILSVPCCIWGPRGMFIVSPVLLFLTMMAFWHLCSRVAGSWTAVLALVLLISVPSVSMNFFWSSSHAPVALFLIAGLIFLERWMKQMKARDALLCGLITGYIPMMRYAELTITLTVGVVVLITVLRRKCSIWRQFGVFCVGAGIPIFFLGAFNLVNFGSPVRTGYYASGEQGAFSLNAFWNNVIPYLQLMVNEFGAHIILLAVVGLILMMRTTGRRTTAVTLILIIGTSLLLYIMFDAIVEMRNLLPCMYLVILAAVYSLKRLFYLLPRLAVPVVIVTAVLSLLNALPHFAITLPVYAQKGSLIRQTSDLVLSYCESGELVATDAFICHNLDVVGDYTLIATDQLEFRLKDWVIKTGETAGGDGSFYVLGVPDLVHQIEIDLPMSCMLDRVQATHLPVHSLWKQWQVILPNLTFTLRQVSFGTEYELVWIHPR